MERKTSRERARLVEDRLKHFRTLKLDPAEVRASREFHYEHWLKVAEAAIRRDHRELFYDGLSAGVEQTVTGYPDDRLPPAMQKAVLRDLAFMEGHLRALQDVLKRLRAARKRS